MVNIGNYMDPVGMLHDAPSQDPPGGLARLRRCGALVLRSPQSQLFLERVAA